MTISNQLTVISTKFTQTNYNITTTKQQHISVYYTNLFLRETLRWNKGDVSPWRISTNRLKSTMQNT